MQYMQHIVFGSFPTVEIRRSKDNGGNVSFSSFSDFEKAYVAGSIHPNDLKLNLAEYINQLLEPVRKHFTEDAAARQLKEQVASFRVTK